MFIGLLESSGTKITMRRPIVCQLCVGIRRETKKYANKVAMIDYHGEFFLPQR